MQLWRPHLMNCYLPDQPNYFVLIILFLSQVILIFFWEILWATMSLLPKAPMSSEESFHMLLSSHYDLKLWFLQLQDLFKQTFHLLHGTKPLEELYSSLILLIIFHHEDTSVTGKADSVVYFDFLLPLTQPLIEVWPANMWDMDWISWPCSE